jgi:ribose transport system permease protein
MTFVIILGGIDLSVGALVAFLGGSGILLMNHLLDRGWGEVAAAGVAFVLMLCLGTVAGMLNGVLITRGKLAPFIATLGGLASYRSIALALADGGEYRSASAEGFKAIGTGGLAIPGTNIAPRAPEPIPLLFPWPVVIFLLLSAGAWVLLNHTRFGRYVIAIGSNERAAVYSAIPVNRIKVLTYMLLGLCVGIASALLSSRMNSVSSAGTGLLYELDVIAAVVIGGTRMRGGTGTIVGTLIGVLILGVVGNMLNLLQVSVYLQGLVKGLIIIGAVLLQRAERL